MEGKTMKRKLISLVSIISAITLFICCCVTTANATQKTSNRFNVVLVIDASGSMNQTDPENLRYDATKLFLGLLANDGNYVGSVIFSTGIDKVSTISEIKGMGDKNKIEKDIESIKPDIGDTAIGVALDKAVQMIKSDGNHELPSVIVLLSDGKTDLSGDKKAEKNSNDLKAQAIYDAHKEGIRIFTVGLNSNGGADMAELQQIAKGTNGECQEVKKASDLKEVFAKFYNLIYSTSTTTIFDGDIGSNGKIDATFTVPDAGVEEVNIIISSTSSIKNLTLDPPESPKMSVSDVEKISTVSKSFTITKITSPEGGEWALHAEGKPGDHVKIDMVYNDCLSVSAECDTNKQYHIGDSIHVSGYLLNYDEIATQGYEDYQATLMLTVKTSDNDADNIENEIPMQVGDSSYTIDIPIDEIGTYSMYMQVVGNGMAKDTKNNLIIINADNSAPVVNLDGGIIEDHFYVWPLFTKEHDIDISGVVSDTEDNKLKYTVINTAFKDTSYELNGETLTIVDFYDLSKGSFTIKATDSMGASVDFEVVVSMTNVGIIALIVLGGIILLVLIALAVLIYYLRGRRLMGTVTITNIETGQKDSQSWSRGPKKLSNFQIGSTGISQKSRILATGKPRIVFVTSKKCISDRTFKPSKNFRINSNDEITVYSDSSKEKGIKILFESYATSRY